MEEPNEAYDLHNFYYSEKILKLEMPRIFLSVMFIDIRLTESTENGKLRIFQR